MQNLFFRLAVSIMLQGKQYVAYSPALDLSTSGKSEREAQRRFDEAVQIFFEELVETGNLDSVLTELGWKKVAKKWQPPKVVSQKSVGIRIPVPA